MGKQFATASETNQHNQQRAPLPKKMLRLLLVAGLLMACMVQSAPNLKELLGGDGHDHHHHHEHHGEHGDHGEHGAHGDHGAHGEHGAHGVAHGEHGAHEHHEHHEHPTTAAAPAPTASAVNDGGRLLVKPDALSCSRRPEQWEFGGHFYFLSQDVDQYKGKKFDWLDARNLCRKYCMDSVSIETELENEMVKSVVEREKLPYVWTSGRMCDFKGCESREDLKPLQVFGWFWPGSNVQLSPTNSTPPGWVKQPWSYTGHFKAPQPDNAEFSINNTTESCLGVLNNVYKDRTQWHDIACYHTKAVIY